MKFICERLNVFVLTLLVSSPTFASSAGGNKVVSVFNAIIDFLTSTLARGVGITAILCMGYLYLFQNKIDKNRAITTCVAIGIILGSSSIYDMLAGA